MLLVPTVVLTGRPSKTEPRSSSYGHLSEGLHIPLSKDRPNTLVLVLVHFGLHSKLFRSTDHMGAGAALAEVGGDIQVKGEGGNLMR